MKGRVVVGMSGGVDSSVAAYLLKEQGYDVIGITMQIWQDEDRCEIEESGGCCGLSAVEDARNVANKLGIPYYVLNFKKEFKESVIDYFIDEYSKGLTPNPCIACNRYVKWESMLNKALTLEADYIATGHYARVVKHPITNRYTIKMANTDIKDQTYALYNLTQFQLEHTLMPVGDYEKPEIRKIASEIGLDVANKPDSQDICFVPDGDYAKFIKENSNIKIKEGNFIDKSGKILGKHKGICNYTIGQRKGLGIAFGSPMYVSEIKADTNEVVLTGNDGLFKNKVLIKDFNFMSVEDIEGEVSVCGKLRYSQKQAPCTIKKLENGLVEATFKEPQRAVTPGQAAVFYDGEYVLGGGVIYK
ncbi:MAG: tRNA 2-thiouridine(34) synthase MnmA [Eubacteriales bacterium]|nr:tRNA 2-thiouridine(34) synthase MnmA [Eubacteriales bacterium]